MRPFIIYLTSFLLLMFQHVMAQLTPDLTARDNFLPYMNEAKKQEQVVNAHVETIKKKYPQTSEELYPHLYKYVQREFLGPIKNGHADPANSFPNYSQTPYVKANAPNPRDPIFNQGQSIDQRNRAIVEADMAAYNSRNLESQRMVDELNRILEKPVINYHLGLHSGERVNPFITAQGEISDMLSGTRPIDFLKAVWLVESAVDRTLTWEEFKEMFDSGIQTIGALMAKEKLNRNDNLAKVMAIYKYMADTTLVYVASKEKDVLSKPMLYDYEDYEAKKDITKIFVSKLLRTGTGQCMSLPMLYYLFAKTINAEVNLAFAPQHSYITFKDNTGNRQNIELTGRMFTSTDFYWTTGFIKTEQVRAGIYLKPLSEKETLAHLLTTLTLSYIRTFGTDERALDMG